MDLGTGRRRGLLWNRSARSGIGLVATSTLLLGGLIAVSPPASAAVSVTPPATATVAAGSSFISVEDTSTTITGFGGSDTVLVTITASAGKVNINNSSARSALTAVTGYPTADWTNGASQIAFSGTQAVVNTALQYLSYQNTSITTATISISAVLAGGTSGGINYSTLAYLPTTGNYYFFDDRDSTVFWTTAVCLSRYNFYLTSDPSQTPVANNDNNAFNYSGGACTPTASYTRVDRTFNGLVGYLATSTSQAENDFIYSKVGGNAGWIAGSDADVEGTWKWVSGPEAGTVFWKSGVTGCTQGLRGTCNPVGQGPQFSYWRNGEPNDYFGEDALEFFGSGDTPAGVWNDRGATDATFQRPYIVEFGGTWEPNGPGSNGGTPLLSGTGTINVTTLGAPTITSVTPSRGSTAGSNYVTITGTNFSGLSGAAAVKFNGVNAASYVVNSVTEIVAMTAAGSAGSGTVTVTTPGGTASSAANAWTYVAPPTISGISPTSGGIAGGTIATITGTNFSSTTSVTVGGAAASFSVLSDTSIRITTPSRPAGAATVVVTTVGGTASSTFTYLAPPALSTITPASGPTTGGTSVTISGSGMSGATGVTFGGVPGTVAATSDTSVTVTAPAGSAGTVTVALTTPGGTSSLTNAYTYRAAPTITSVSPATGAESGGQQVTITGTGFTGATAVNFGSTAALSYTVDSDTKITAEAPPKGSMASTVNVSVVTIGGTGTKSSAFTFVAGPTITAVSPATGPIGGGTSVTITGTGLSSATSVTFGGVAGTVTSNTATQIVVQTPANVAGAVNVGVATSFGATGSPAAFTYVEAPNIASITPATGPTGGGTSVTISGTGFTGATAVRFGSTNAASFTVVNATTITAVTPVKAAGAADVVVITPGGTGTLTNGFTFANVPTVTSLSPSSGGLAGGTTVTITGADFTGATGVTFGGVAAGSFTVVNATTITAVTPAGAAGAVTVAVTTPGGTGTKASGYTYANSPAITSLSPAAGPIAGGTTVTITGTDLSAASAVTFGGTPATSVTVINGTTVTAVAPAKTAGAVTVAITTPGGSGSLAASYEYFNVPTVTAVSPASGGLSGGETISITGTNLLGATQVLFDDSTATFTVNSASSITATAPAESAGLVTVSVVTPGGTGSKSGAYTYAAKPTVTSVVV
ncbi:MAG: IPT/TIG domain-containing protein, partial [Actinomycetales bacterium]|nr:IPT/TIG domain-containing protein [Actinomycetales bacterium]